MMKKNHYSEAKKSPPKDGSPRDAGGDERKAFEAPKIRHEANLVDTGTTLFGS